MPYDPIKVADYKAFGLLVHDWAKNPGNRPRTLGDFMKLTSGILELPGRITEDPTYPYPQWSVTNLVLRLPAPELVQQSIDKLTANPGVYPAPPFYQDLVNGNLSGVEGLYHRIGDYTIAQCF